MTSGISFHVLYDAIDSDANPLRVAVASLQPRVINIVGGARKTQAFTFAIEMKKKYPSMRVIFRSWPDDGNHDTEKYKLKYHRDTFGNLIVDDASGCQRWVDDNSNYLLAGLTVLTDNESMRADLDVYSEWQSRIMDLTGTKGWSVAVGRFATGNPPKAQLPQLQSMFRALLKWGDLHCFSPNEYFSNNPTRNGGNVYRYQDAVDYAKSIGAWPFPVNIGEFGMLVMDASGRLDPEAGFKDSKIGLSHRDAARFTINTWADWYKAEGVDVCIYCWGGDGSAKWERCRVDNDSDFLKVLLDAATIGELEPLTIKSTPTPVPKPTPTVPAPAYTGIPQTIVVKGNASWYLRTEPDLHADIVGSVKVGESIDLYTSTIQPNGGANYFYVHRATAPSGESVSGWLAYVMPVTAPLPPVVIPDNPPPSDPVPSVPYPEVSAKYAREMANCYRSLATTYKLMSDDSQKTAEQWAKLADVIEGKKAA